MFGLSSFYRCGVVRHFVTAFYLCESVLDKQSKCDQSKKLNYGR